MRFFDPSGRMLPTEAGAAVARAQREARRADEEATARRAAEAEIARLKALLEQRQG